MTSPGRQLRKRHVHHDRRMTDPVDSSEALPEADQELPRDPMLQGLIQEQEYSSHARRARC